MRSISIVVLAAVAVSLLGCRQKPPPEPGVATPSVTLKSDRAALGSPIEVTYRFDVAANAPPLTEDYKVFVGFVDTDQELMWTDDHDAAVPPTQWKPGQTIEYTRTVFVPVYPYIGEAAIHMGLYSPTTQKRLTLSGTDAGQNAYTVAKIQLLPQSENVFIVLKDGWHGPESPPNDAHIEWQWTRKKQSTLAFKNPRKDAEFFLDLDNPSRTFPEGQHVQVKVADQVLDDFVLNEGRQLRRIPLTVAQLGAGETVELSIEVDKTFVPALLPGSTNRDSRELGVRVFHWYVQPKK
ncbi:MAG: hypothetical protein ABI868_20850 [Acidobacteriota bacterium]